jgi:hypothetical protein
MAQEGTPFLAFANWYPDNLESQINQFQNSKATLLNNMHLRRVVGESSKEVFAVKRHGHSQNACRLFQNMTTWLTLAHHQNTNSISCKRVFVEKHKGWLAIDRVERHVPSLEYPFGPQWR